MLMFFPHEKINQLLKKCTYAAFCVQTDNEVLDTNVSKVYVQKHWSL